MTAARTPGPAGRLGVPTLVLAAVAVLTVTLVGVLVTARHISQTVRTAASSASVTSQGPVATATSVQLSALSTGVVWALVNNDRLYRSTDQGNHWEQRPVFGNSPRAISFIDDHQGWLLAAIDPAVGAPDDLIIWHTKDAGATWQALPPMGALISIPTGIWFTDDNHGFVVGRDWNDPNHKPDFWWFSDVWRSSDGGQNWAAARAFPDPASLQWPPNNFVPHIGWIKSFGGTLYLEEFDKTVFVLKSNDGGANLTVVTKVSSPNVVMVTESRWLELSSPGRSLESIDGGQQFHPFASDFDNSLVTQFAFADANVGYAVGGGRAQRTLDGGVHWTTLPIPWA